jgi:hypothetical protein
MQVTSLTLAKKVEAKKNRRIAAKKWQSLRRGEGKR